MSVGQMVLDQTTWEQLFSGQSNIFPTVMVGPYPQTLDKPEETP